MTRRAFLGTALTLPVWFAGCDTLDQLDQSARAEGTGVQIFGAITVIARYHASASQTRIAEDRAGKAYVEQALKPAYEKRKRSLESAAKEKARDTERTYRKKIARARVGERAKIEQERARELVRVKEESAAAIATASASWYKEASAVAGAGFAGQLQTPASGQIAYASLTGERNLLLAQAASYLPRYIAVSVPPAGASAEARAADSVMIWDTERRQLANNEVLVIDRKPKTGKITDFGGISAAYTGAGNF